MHDEQRRRVTAGFDGNDDRASFRVVAVELFAESAKRGVMKQAGDADAFAEGLFDFGHKLHRQHRVAAEVKKVVVHSDVGNFPRVAAKSEPGDVPSRFAAG